MTACPKCGRDLFEIDKPAYLRDHNEAALDHAVRMCHAFGIPEEVWITEGLAARSRAAVLGTPKRKRKRGPIANVMRDFAFFYMVQPRIDRGVNPESALRTAVQHFRIYGFRSRPSYDSLKKAWQRASELMRCERLPNGELYWDLRDDVWFLTHSECLPTKKP